MRFSETCTVMALMLLCVAGAATASLKGLVCSGPDTDYAGLTDVSVIGEDAISSAPAFPEMASNPIPPNGAVNVSVETDLGWTAGICGADNFGQSVYLSTDPADLWSGYMGTTDLDFFELGTLQNNTTYYWQIDTFCTDIVFMGDTWEFTTVPEPTTLLLLGLGGVMVRRKR